MARIAEHPQRLMASKEPYNAVEPRAVRPVLNLHTELKCLLASPKMQEERTEHI